jgi:hypothetical protein
MKSTYSDRIVGWFLLLLITAITFLIVGYCRAGDTYDCINAKGDYINYGPAAPVADPRAVIAQIVVAPNSAATSPRWQPMLDPNDYRNLEYIRARHPADIYIAP